MDFEIFLQIFVSTYSMLDVSVIFARKQQGSIEYENLHCNMFRIKLLIFEMNRKKLLKFFFVFKIIQLTCDTKEESIVIKLSL